LAVAPKGNSIIAMSDYGPIVVWDLRTGRPVRSWIDIAVRPDNLALSPDRKTFFACGGGWSPEATEVHSWDVRTGKHRAQLSDGPARIDFLGVSGDGKSLVAFGDGAVAVWDLATGKQRRLKVRPPSRFGPTTVGGLAVSADGRTLVTRGEKAVQLLDLTTGKERLLGRHQGFVYNAAVSPDGKSVVSCSEDRTARLWDISGKHPARVFKHEGEVWSAAFSPDGKRLALIESSPNVVHIWDLETGRRLRRLPHQGGISALVFLPGGEDLITGDCRVRIWNLASGRERFPSEGSGPVQTAPVFASDGRQVAVRTGTSIEI
jgi:WD40 repeat protein